MFLFENLKIILTNSVCISKIYKQILYLLQKLIFMHSGLVFDRFRSKTYCIMPNQLVLMLINLQTLQ